jgi:hypothetical protein
MVVCRFLQPTAVRGGNKCMFHVFAQVVRYDLMVTSRYKNGYISPWWSIIDIQYKKYYCLRLVPPVGRRLELGLVRNMLASLFICPNVMQLMLPLHLLMHLCFGISFSNSMCRKIVPHYAVTTRHRVIFSHPHSCSSSYPYSFLHLRTPTPKTFNS